MKKDKYEHYFIDLNLFGRNRLNLFYLIISKVLPKSLSPNTLTTLSFLANLITFFIIISFGCTEHTLPYIFPLIILYLFADNLDGMVARKYNKESSLGELLDHTGDVFGISIVFLVIYTYLGGTAVIPYSIFASGIGIGVSCIFSQEYKTEWLKLPDINFIEVFFIICFIIIFFTYTPFSSWISQFTIYNFTLIECTSFIVFPFYILISIFKFRKDKEIFIPLVCNLLGLITLCSLTLTAPFWFLYLFILFYNLLFIPRIIMAHLTNCPFPYPDISSIILLFSSYFIGIPNIISFVITLSYMFLKWLYQFQGQIERLRNIV